MLKKIFIDHWRYWMITAVLVASIFLYWERNNNINEQADLPVVKNPSSLIEAKLQQQQNTEVTLAPFLLKEYEHAKFSIPASVRQGEVMAIKWTSNELVRSWGDKADICLIGLNSKKEVIKLSGDKELCYPDFQVLVGAATISSGAYSWSVGDYSNKFLTVPTSYQLSVRVIDARPKEPNSEWAGEISEATSNEFYITSASANQKSN